MQPTKWQLPTAATLESAVQVNGILQDIRRAVEKAPITYLGRPLGTVTMSIGVASTEEGQPTATLMARADAALLRAKASGRNVVVTD